MLGLEPAPVVGLTMAVTALFAGDRHFCALLANGDLACWGEHQAGGSATASATTPEVVARGVESASLGDGLSFALLESGEVRSWGSANPELLYRTPYPRFSPTPCCSLTP